MNEILNPETRSGMTPKEVNNFIRSSNAIGSSAQQSIKKVVEDPANFLKPKADFRKSIDASMGNRLWTNENEFDMYESRQMTKHEVCKSRSRERYFQSSLTTLPGPSVGLNCVEIRNQT